MSGPNGGWLVFQQRINASVNFTRGWASYRKGFGRHGLEFWLGNLYIHSITRRGEHILRIEKSASIDGRKQTFFAEYDSFRLSSPFDNYNLHVGKYQGNLSDILWDANNSAFSTWDRDNDMVNGSCALRNKGAWWYERCHHSNLNGLYHHGAHSSSADGVNWYHWKGHNYSVKRAEMKIKPVKF